MGFDQHLSNIFMKMLSLERYHQNSQAVFSGTGVNLDHAHGQIYMEIS